MSINSLSSSLAQPWTRPLTIEPRTPSTPEDLKAAWRAKNPLLTPQQAFASGAESGPPSGDPRADNHASKIHTEIKVNGKVIARTYNSGAVEIASEYSFLSEELDFGADKGVGPDLAANRAARINALLERYGAGDEGRPQPLGADGRHARQEADPRKPARRHCADAAGLARRDGEARPARARRPVLAGGLEQR
jgi:hypothetical protein